MDYLPLKDIATVVGLAATGLYFYYKVISGGMAVNMSLAVNAERTRSIDGNGLASITVNLEKGDQGSVSIYDFQAKVTPEGEGPIHKSFTGTSRQDWNEDYKIQWDSTRSGSGYTNNPYLRITPGEKMHFALIVSVPSNSSCEVEVVILGKRDFSPFIAQWKSSTVLLPEADKT